MSERTVWTFHYGSFINPDVWHEVGYVPERYEVAKLSGFDIRLLPLATLVRSDQYSVYGIVARATHEQNYRLYSQDCERTYLPEPVLVETLDGKMRAALCYIALVTATGTANNECIDRILKPSIDFSLPSWYVARLESFRPTRKAK